MSGKRRGPLLERIEKRIFRCPVTGCWLWTGTKRNGYGVIVVEKDGVAKPHYAHRIIWELNVGPIPEGMLVCHHCDVQACVNWKRCLFIGTHKDNGRDMSMKGRSARHQHPENYENVMGEKHHKAKLTKDNVVFILAELARGASLASLGRTFNVDPSIISAIRDGKIWKSVPRVLTTRPSMPCPACGVDLIPAHGRGRNDKDGNTIDHKDTCQCRWCDWMWFDDSTPTLCACGAQVLVGVEDGFAYARVLKERFP